MAGSIMAGQTTNYLFDYPTSTDYVKDGATAIETLADDVDATLFTALGGAYPGLRLVKKQTIGTSVTSVTLTNAFSATYENYLIKISGGAHATGGSQFLGFRLGASPSGVNSTLVYAPFAGGAVLNAHTSNGTVFNYAGSAQTSGLNATISVNSPFLAKQSMVEAAFFDDNNSGRMTGVLNNTTSYTEFTISTSGGMTGGTIYVYGFGIS
jgi:hypothetical protein